MSNKPGHLLKNPTALNDPVAARSVRRVRKAFNELAVSALERFTEKGSARRYGRRTAVHA
jgi:hypothetical protein